MADSSSEIFNTYFSEYTTLSASLKTKLSETLPTAPNAESRKLVLSQTERELEEAEEILHQLEVEILSLPVQQRTRLQPKVKDVKAEIDGFKKDLRKIITASQADRDALLGRKDVSLDIAQDARTQDQRARLLQGTERLEQGSKRLEEARRLALEAESTGIQTLETLSSQREQMLRTRDRLGEADGFVATSQRVLKGMQRRLVANKIISIAIIIMLVVMILMVIYIKLF